MKVPERRDRVLTLRVSEGEEKIFRLVARVQDVNLSEMIRRAVRDRADALSDRGATS